MTASLIQKRPWARQPQTQVRVNSASPLTRQLSALALPSLGYQELANRRIVTLDSSMPRAIGRAGVGYDGDGSTTGLSVAHPDVTGAYTMFALVETDTTSGTRNMVSLGGLQYAVQFRMDSTQWSLYHFGSTDHLASEAGAVTTGTVHAMVATWNGGNTIRLYRGGVQRGINTSVAGIRGTITKWNIGQSNYGAKEAWDGRIFLAGLVLRQWSDAEVAQWSANPWQIFEPRRIWVPVEAGGSPTYNETLTETSSATDSATNVCTFPRSLAETLTLTDTPAGVATFPRALSESQTLTDTATNVATFPRSLTESQTLTDSATNTVTGGATYNETISETSSVTDTAASVLTAVGTLAESATSTDSVIVGGVYNVTTSESVTLTDALTAPGTFALSLSESQTLTDAYADAANETTINVLQPYVTVYFWKRTA